MAENTILIATDGSPAAQAAAHVAIEIAAARQMALRGLYIVDEALALDSYASPEPELGIERAALSRPDLIREFEVQGNRALEWLQARAAEAGVPVETDLLAGGVPELVLREAADAHMLALGRRGNSHAADPDALGRHFLNIAHHAHLPILVGGAGSRAVHRLLLVYDHQDEVGEESTWAASLQRALLTDIVVLFVDGELGSDRTQQSLARIKDQLAASHLSDYRLSVEQGESALQITATADSQDIDLIVMGRYRHRALVEWMLGSTVDRVLRATPLPVLLV